MDTPKKRMLAAQTLYEQMTQDNAHLEAFERALTTMAARAGEMRDYYQAQWLQDMEALEQAGEYLEVMGEDPIFIQLESQYDAIKRILLKCAEYINR